MLNPLPLPLFSSDSTEERLRVSVLKELDLLDTPREEAFDELVELAAEICQAPIGLMSLLDFDRQWFKASVGLDVQETPIDGSFCKWAIRQNELFVVEDTMTDSRFQSNPFVAGEPNIRFYAGMPLRLGDQINIGTLCVVDRVPRRLGGVQLRALTILARQIQTQIEIRSERKKLRSALEANEALVVNLEARNKELSEANERLEQLALTDPLTGLLNRREFERALDDEWRRSTRSDKPLSVLMIDTDCFKDYNDVYGHLKGDACLKRIAHTLSAVPQRPGDVVARFGGEEFVVLLPETDRHGAELVAERICSAVKELSMEHRGSPHSVVTVSVGCATLHPKDELHSAMLTHAADLALYEAKRAGRNCVRTVLHPDALPHRAEG